MGERMERPHHDDAGRQDAERKYQQLFYNSPAIKLVIDPATGNIIEANRAASRYYGYSEQELSAMTIAAIDISEAAAEQLCQELTETGKTLVVKHRLKNGALRDVKVYAGVIDLQGKRCVTLIVSDITEQKLLEERMLNTEQKLRDFIQAIPDRSYILDEDGCVREAFGRANQRLPLTQDEMIGKYLDECLPPEVAMTVLKELQRSLALNAMRYFIQEMRDEAGSYCLEIRISPMTYTVKRKRTAVMVVTDITEQKQNERLLHSSYELRRRNMLIQDMIRGRTLSGREAMEQSAVLGIDLMRPLFCCLIALAGIQGDCSVIDKQQVIHMLVTQAEATRQGVVWEQGGHIGILYPGCCGQDLINKERAAAIQEKISAEYPHITAKIGIGNVQTGVDAVAKSCRQAWSALAAVNCRQAAGISHFQEIGVYQLLAGFSNWAEAREYVQDKIGRLLEYDRQKNSNLTDTLAAILETGNLKEAGKLLFLHHKTVVLRKQRIEQILECSLENFEVRLALALALKLYELQNTML